MCRTFGFCAWGYRTLCTESKRSPTCHSVINILKLLYPSVQYRTLFTYGATCDNYPLFVPRLFAACLDNGWLLGYPVLWNFELCLRNCWLSCYWLDSLNVGSIDKINAKKCIVIVLIKKWRFKFGVYKAFLNNAYAFTKLQEIIMHQEIISINAEY